MFVESFNGRVRDELLVLRGGLRPAVSGALDGGRRLR
jgi:hypothetical protein